MALLTNVAYLDGGTRHGETTTVSEGVTRLYTPSHAPGLLDVYEYDGQTRQLEGNPGPVLVFRYAGQEPTDRVQPESVHMPQSPYRGHG